MDASRLTFTDNGFNLAVAVRREQSRFRHTHVGLCYRDNGELWFLHLAWDRALSHERFDASYACAVPNIPPLRLPFFIRLCCAIRDRPLELRYALRHPVNARFAIQGSGEVVLTDGGNGLNCATFVLVFFQSYGWPLIDLQEWRERPEDAAWHTQLVAWVENSDSAHANLIRSEIGCARVRPEETAGACLHENPPACFYQCVANGQYILSEIDTRLSSSTTP